MYSFRFCHVNICITKRKYVCILMNVLYTVQVTFFMSQVQNSQTVITASGLFTVNKTILSSVSIIGTINNHNFYHHRHSFNGAHKIPVELILGFFWCGK